MTSLISLFALFLIFVVVYQIVGNPLVDRTADKDALHKLTRKDHR